jgi:hypothetical protein
MRKIYSALSVSRTNAYFKNFALTLFSFIFLNLTDVGAQSGNALSYDGADDFTTLAPGIVLGVTGSYTIEAWVYWRGDAGSGTTWQRVIDFGSATDNWAAFTTADPGGNPLFGVQVGGGPLQTVSSSIALSLNIWTHLAVTVNDATDVATIYVNGVASGTSGGFTYHLSDLGNTINNWIGRSQFPTDPYFNGAIDELRISNVVRYTAGFTPPYTPFSSDANTVALFHFTEAVGQTTADASGNFAAATLGTTNGVESSDPTWIMNSILPIKLTGFSLNALNSNNAVDLKWSASLDRGSEFIVERSSNARDFTAIGRVNKATGSDGIEVFSYRDNAPLSGRSYYRLKCIETGSAPFYSKIIPIMLSSKEELVVYPNPVKGNIITVESSKPYTGNVEISVSNSSGAVVFRQKINAVDQREFRVNRNGAIPAGTYLVEIIANGDKQSKMIVCQ